MYKEEEENDVDVDVDVDVDDDDDDDDGLHYLELIHHHKQNTLPPKEIKFDTFGYWFCLIIMMIIIMMSNDE